MGRLQSAGVAQAPPPLAALTAANDPSASIAYATALKIERDIIRRDLPGGALVGSCKSLAEHYGVGRQAMGEAVRIVEARGLARMRPGPHGGLVVAGPVLEQAAACAAKALVLSVPLDSQDIATARAYLGAACLRLTQAEPGAAGARLARWFMAAGGAPVTDGRGDFLLALATATGNGPALLFAALAAALDPGLASPPGLPEDGERRSRQNAIVAAVIQGQIAEAQMRLDDYMTATARPPTPVVDLARAADGPTAVPRTRAGQIARAILKELTTRRAAGQACDGVLGNIDALCETHRVCRATAVQALRLLETSGVISVRSGRGQGYSLQPNGPDRVLAQLVDFLGERPGAAEASRRFLSALPPSPAAQAHPILGLAQRAAEMLSAAAAPAP